MPKLQPGSRLGLPFPCLNNDAAHSERKRSSLYVTEEALEEISHLLLSGDGRRAWLTLGDPDGGVQIAPGSHNSLPSAPGTCAAIFFAPKKLHEGLANFLTNRL